MSAWDCLVSHGTSAPLVPPMRVCACSLAGQGICCDRPTAHPDTAGISRSWYVVDDPYKRYRGKHRSES